MAIIILGSVVFAVNTENDKNILTNEKISSIEESYIEINPGIALASEESEKIIEISNYYMDKFKINSEKFNKETSKINKYNNALYSREEIVISNENTIIKIDVESEKILAYINNKSEFEKTNENEESIEKKAIELLKSIENEQYDKYELIYLEKYDDEIWRAGFAKKYDNLLNYGESIKFSFCPMTNELVTLAINYLEYANNETVITEKVARNIAENYLDISVASDFDLSLEIVRPNYFYKSLYGDKNIYKKINKARKVYVANFNNESKSKVYIDATTGEVVGGDMILGGEY